MSTTTSASASGNSRDTLDGKVHPYNHNRVQSHVQEEQKQEATTAFHTSTATEVAAATPTTYSTPNATPNRNAHSSMLTSHLGGSISSGISSSGGGGTESPMNQNPDRSAPSSVGRGASSSSSSGKNHNYSAPHTPIASAKRPRNPYSSRRSTGATKNKVTHGNYNSNSASFSATSEYDRSTSLPSKGWNLLGGARSFASSPGSMNSGSGAPHTIGKNSNSGSLGSCSNMGCDKSVVDQVGIILDGEEEEEECTLSSVMSPVRKMKLVEGSPGDVNATPMSPMHPVRPVTKYDKDVTMPDSTGVKILLSQEEDFSMNSAGGSGRTSTTGIAQSGNNSHSTSPSVLKSIFSPVLNFLNHSSTTNKDATSTAGVAETGGGAHGQKHKDKHSTAQAAASAEPTGTSTNVQPAHDIQQHDATQKYARDVVDLDGDVQMQGGDNVKGTVEEETLSSPVVDHRIHHAEEEEDYGHFAVTTPTVDSQQDDVSVQDHEELDIEEEFNPYLFIKYLPPYETVVPNPHHKICLPPKDPSDPPISLVLDLDETLVHCTVEPISDADMTFPVVFNGLQYKVHVRLRPFLADFLKAVHDKFEVIVFTASQEVYANELLNRIDPGECDVMKFIIRLPSFDGENINTRQYPPYTDKKYIKHRMFRESCLLVEGNFLKDLNVLGRDLSQTVLVDNSPHAFGYQINNGIPIESWFDDPNDTELLKLKQFCSTLHGVKDVRTMVRSKFQTYKLIRDA
jgi:TFIIF-interacting CTD phosphatases, including NLI-interacting factor